MDWSNELYVKVYTRETDDDLALSWEARALWDRMLTKFDRAGLIATKRGARGLAALVRIPATVVERVVPELLADGRVAEVDGGYLAPNFTAAQDASKSDRLRQKESRDRVRASKMGTVTNRDATVTNRDENSPPAAVDVTKRHELSRDVTLSLAELNEAERSESPAGARARSSHPEPTPGPQTRPPPEPSPGALAEPPPLAISAPIAQAPVARMGAAASAPAAGWAKLAHDAWTHGATAYRELLAEGVDASANPDAWNGLPRPIVTDRTREMREAGLSVEAAWRRILGAFATAAATARKKRTLRWLVPSRFFGPQSFDIDADATPEQVASTQPLPRSHDGPPEEKSITIGRPRAPGDDEPRFSERPDYSKRMTPEERASKLAALLAAERVGSPVANETSSPLVDPSGTRKPPANRKPEALDETPADRSAVGL